jgi:hypothetical protein
MGNTHDTLGAGPGHATDAAGAFWGYYVSSAHPTTPLFRGRVVAFASGGGDRITVARADNITDMVAGVVGSQSISAESLGYIIAAGYASVVTGVVPDDPERSDGNGLVVDGLGYARATTAGDVGDNIIFGIATGAKSSTGAELVRCLIYPFRY